MSKLPFAFCAAVLLAVASPLSAAAPHTYQVTGPVLEVTPTSIIVQKGNEKWEIAKDASAKITGEVKVGAKVTIEYYMTATTVTVKPDKK